MASAMLQEAAAQVYNVRGERIPNDIPGAKAMGLRAPAGVALSIAPWNAPLVLAMRAIAFPVAYGNTVVVKAGYGRFGGMALIHEFTELRWTTVQRQPRKFHL
jgi:hypothetical protein